jgi:tricorn protease
MVARSAGLGLVLLAASSVAAPLQRASDPAVSPDGRLVAFAWQKDVWLVPAEGGTARRLTAHPAEDSMPRWSLDGKRLFFVSNRFGNLDFFSMDPDGQDIRRHTWSSSDEYWPTASPDGQWLYGYTNHWGRLDLFRVRASGGEIVRITLHPFEMEYTPSVSPDGATVAYVTGGSAGSWRKPGLTGANTGKLWVAEAAVWLGRDTLLFVSNRSGAPNLWTVGANGRGARQVTQFPSGTVRSLTATSDGRTAVFLKDSRVWSCDLTSGQASPMSIQTPDDATRDAVVEVSLSTATEFAVSTDGKRAVVGGRGDLFLMPERGGTTRRLTTNPGWDGQASWLDEKTVLYVSAREGAKRELRTVTVDGQDRVFMSATKDLTGPQVSPDRKWVAFVRGDSEVLVAPAGGGEPKLVATGAFSDALSRARVFSWSPDSQWIVLLSPKERGIEVGLARIDGTKTVLAGRIGKSGSTPVFTGDGRALAFSVIEGLDYSESRDSSSPLSVIELRPRSLEFREDDLDKIDAAKAEEPKDVVVSVVEEGLLDRRRRLDTGDVSGVWPGPDGKSVYANVDGQFSTVDVTSGSARPVTGVTGSVQDVVWSPDRKKVYIVQAGRPSALNPQGASPLAFTLQWSVDQAGEEAALFDEVWWAMDRLYYDPRMNGKDWPAIKREFATLVPTVQGRDDFYALMTEMMERLDSSHLGATAPASPRGGVTDETAWLGVEWDWSALDSSGTYRVAKVYHLGPAAHPDSRLQIGDVVTAVDGRALSSAWPMAAALNEKADRKVALSVRRGAEDLTVLVRAASLGSRSNAFYEDWVRWCRAETDRLSGGKLGYVHIQGMDAESLDRFLVEIQTELEGKSGVVVDVRYNGGGFTSHIILNVMRKVPWLIRTNRDAPALRFSENNFRGNSLELPAACLTNEYSFSNAEIFSEGFRRMGLGPVVGERTAGGVIGTGGYGLWDGGFIRMPGSGAFAIDGEDLEGNGRRPDIDVPWDVVAWQAGRDTQLERAVKELMRRVQR